MRAAAAMAVLIFHATQRAGTPLGVGAAGVDVFFVISGFVMATATRARPVGAGEFLLHRTIRIVPAYWAVTLAMTALAQLPGAFPALRPTISHVVLSLLFVPHPDPAGGPFPLVAAGWTLNVEMGFYLLFAAGLSLPARMRLLCVTGVLGGLIAIGWLLHPDGVAAAVFTDPIVLEFAAGLWLAKADARRSLPTGWGAGLLLALGLAGFAAQGWLGSTDASWRLLAWGGPALLVVAGGLGLEQGRPLPTTRPAQRGSMQAWSIQAWPMKAGLALGEASYMIYLVHGLVVSASWRLLPGGGMAFLAASAAGSLGAGLWLHQAMERPVTAWLRRISRAGTRRRLALAEESG